MDGRIEQCVCIKFCMKLSKSATETPEMLREAFGEHSLSRTAVLLIAFTFQGWSSVSLRWRTFRATKHMQNHRKRWKNSRTHPRRPSPSNPWVHRHRWEQLWSLPVDLNMRRIAAKFVPRLLTNDQKQWRVNVCSELRERANEDPAFISRIITGDECWIYGYDPETK
jgi:hypothetical protein